MTDTLEQRARGLLASEFPLADGFSAVLVRDMSIPQLGVVDTAIALRAIVAALQAQQPAEPMFTATMYGSAEAASKARAEWEAQQPGAQAVDLYTVDDSAQACSDGCCGGCQFRPYIPQPPSIPEPSDVDAALSAFDSVPPQRRWRAARMRAALTTDRARLRERMR